MQEEFRLREENLRKNDLELQDSLIKFNKFLQENKTKQNRATKRFEQERELRKAKEIEVQELRRKLALSRTKNENLRDLLLRRRKYQAYLERVAEFASDDYEEISEILGRYRTLRGARDDLKRRQETAKSSAESVGASLNAYTKERTNEILGLNNRLSQLRKNIESYETSRIGVQNEVNANVRSACAKTVELGEIFMAVSNLRQRCRSKFGKRIMHSANEETRKKKSKEGNADGRSSPENEEINAGVHLMEKGQDASRDLSVIQSYVRDFETIIRDCPKEKRGAPL